MSAEKLAQYPGRSPGYAFMPEETRRQIAVDVPRRSELVREEAERYAYVDTAVHEVRHDEGSLREAGRMLVGRSGFLRSALLRGAGLTS